MLKHRLRLKQTGKLLQLPSQHASLASAQTLYEVCEDISIDRFALELPRDIDPPMLSKAAEESKGKIGLLVAVEEREIVDSVPDPDDPTRTTQKRLRRAVAIPITPSDSIGLALLLPSIRRDLWTEKSPEFVLMDAARREDSRSDKSTFRSKRLPDPYTANFLGMSAYLNDIKRSIRRPKGNIRDRTMAATLRPFTSDAKCNTLAVYGAAHHDPIEHHLHSMKRSRLPAVGSKGDTKFRFIPLEPLLAYQMGVTDVPFFTWHFLNAIEQRLPFDQGIATRRLLEAALASARREGIPVPIQKVKTMLRYMNGLCKSRSLLFPRLRNELVHSATTCVNAELAEVMWRTAMQYTPNDKGECATVAIDRNNRVFLFYQGMVYRTDLRAQPSEKVNNDTSRTEPSLLTKRERSIVRSSPCMLPPVEEGQLVADMNDFARRRAHQSQRKFVRRDFSGDFGEGICLSSTAQRQLRFLGKKVPTWKTLVVRQAVQPSRHCSEACPVVWCFSSDAAIVSRQTGSLVTQKYGWVKSSFYWRSEHSRAVDDCGAVRRSRTAYCTFLLREMPQPYDEENVTRLLTAYGEDRFCRTAPWNDPELHEFQGFDLAVASGVKYALGHVVVVAPGSVVIGKQVAEFSDRRRVRILRLDAEAFNPEFFERMAIDHELRAEGYYAKPHPFLSRFVTPLPKSAMW